MKQYTITIKKNGFVINELDKVPFDLNPSRNIVQQTEEKVADLLCGEGYDLRVADVAWKVYRYDGKRYVFVSRSENWVGD